MSKYSKAILTDAGIDLAKRANAGQAKFKLTRTVTSADDFSQTPIEQLAKMTVVPNIMQEGQITDAEDLESDNAIIGVSLRFTNKNLKTGYKARLVGLYVREEGQNNDILYALTTASEPEYIPDFNDNVLYRFNLQMYVVVGRTQAVNVMVDDGTVVSVKKFEDYKKTIEKRFDQFEESHPIKAVTINGGDEVGISNGVLNLDIPKPDLRPYATKADLEKIQKDISNGLGGVYTSTQIDNLLKLKLDKIPKKLTGTVDLNNITETGIYDLSGATKLINSPAGSTSSYLEVITTADGKSYQTVHHMNGYPTYYRGYTEDNKFIEWQAYISHPTINALRSQIEETKKSLKQMKEDQFEVKTFKKGQESEANAWEAQKVGKRLAILED